MVTRVKRTGDKVKRHRRVVEGDDLTADYLDQHDCHVEHIWAKLHPPIVDPDPLPLPALYGTACSRRAFDTRVHAHLKSFDIYRAFTHGSPSHTGTQRRHVLTALSLLLLAFIGAAFFMYRSGVHTCESSVHFAPGTMALVPDTMANVSALGNASWLEALPQSFGAAQAA